MVKEQMADRLHGAGIIVLRPIDKHRVVELVHGLQRVDDDRVGATWIVSVPCSTVLLAIVSALDHRRLDTLDASKSKVADPICLSACCTVVSTNNVDWSSLSRHFVFPDVLADGRGVSEVQP